MSFHLMNCAKRPIVVQRPQDTRETGVHLYVTSLAVPKAEGNESRSLFHPSTDGGEESRSGEHPESINSREYHSERHREERTEP